MDILIQLILLKITTKNYLGYMVDISSVSHLQKNEDAYPFTRFLK